jgi:hypothetical protein
MGATITVRNFIRGQNTMNSMHHKSPAAAEASGGRHMSLSPNRLTTLTTKTPAA